MTRGIQRVGQVARRALRVLRQQSIGVAALLVALSGTAYAATALPRNSVGPVQLRTDAVTTGKVRNGSLRSVDFQRGDLPRGARGPAGPRGPGAVGIHTTLRLDSESVPLGAVGPWRLSGSCRLNLESGNQGVLIELAVRGPGGLTATSVFSRNDGPTTTSHRVVQLDGTTKPAVWHTGRYAYHEYSRTSSTLLLVAGAQVATVSVETTVSGTGPAPGDPSESVCFFTGTAVAAHAAVPPG